MSSKYLDYIIEEQEKELPKNSEALIFYLLKSL